MKHLFDIFIVLISAYLIGSIPTSIWVGKLFFKIDIREFGSGNAGASNAIRTFGFATGFFVLVFDMFKGFAAVKLLNLFSFVHPDTPEFVNIQIICGIAAVIGHIYPIYAGFRGGKGVATVFGVLLGLHPLATICAAGIFLAGFLATKYTSVGSLMAGLSFPVLIIWVFHTPYIHLEIFSVLVFLLLVFTHRKNIGRLISGNEIKTRLFSNNKEQGSAQ